jgi:hypothetical protein
VIHSPDYIQTDIIPEYLDTLARYTEPSKTLLVLNRWKKYPKPTHRDHDIPNFVASEHGSAFNREARKRGFRTMYFTNYLSIATTNPRFDDFRPYFIKDPYTHQHIGFNLQGEWSAFRGYDPVLYYVNSAYKGWREYLIGQFTTLFETDPADAIYIDQTFNMYNDENGLIEGMNNVEGNLAFHRELLEALPGVALGGEGINEINMQYEAFCSPWYLGTYIKLDKNGNALGFRLDPGAWDRMVPMLPRYHEPLTVSIRSKHPIYGGIARIHAPSLKALEDPTSKARREIKKAMAAARPSTPRDVAAANYEAIEFASR